MLTLQIYDNYLVIGSLCRPRSNRVKGLPFRPVRAIPVDMFPHTPHCELVVLFERICQHEVLEQILKDDFEPETTTSLS